MNSTVTAGRMFLWAIKLSKFDVQYRPRIAIKAQVLVDFMAEFTPIEVEKAWNGEQHRGLSILTAHLTSTLVELVFTKITKR